MKLNNGCIAKYLENPLHIFTNKCDHAHKSHDTVSLCELARDVITKHRGLGGLSRNVCSHNVEVSSRGQGVGRIGSPEVPILGLWVSLFSLGPHLVSSSGCVYVLISSSYEKHGNTIKSATLLTVMARSQPRDASRSMPSVAHQRHWQETVRMVASLLRNSHLLLEVEGTCAPWILKDEQKPEYTV